MAGKNYGPIVSGYLNPVGRNWETVVNQAGKAILDVEQNLLQDIDIGQAEADITRALPSGWIANEFLNSTAGTLPLFASSAGANVLTLQNALKAHVNGWLFLIENTGVINTNTVTLPAAPSGNGAQRTDLVFLEVWRLLLSPAGAVGPPAGNFGKSPSGLIWGNGNVKNDPSNDATLNYPDDILDATRGVESTKRVQLQYRLRVVSGVDVFTYPYGLDNTAIVFANTVPPNSVTPNGSPTSFTYANQSANGDAGLWIAGDGNPANALGTVDGFMYAIPLCAVFRRNQTAFDQFANLNGAGPSSGASGRPDNLFNDEFISDDIADLRMAISPTGWSYPELLDKNLTYLLDNVLRSEWTFSSPYGGGTTGHTPFFSNQIGVSSANGGTAPYSGDGTGGGPRVAQFDAACRTFSGRPVFESIVVAVPAPGGAWADSATFTINPSALPIYPYSAFNWSSFAPTNVQFVDVLDAWWAGTTNVTKRYDALNTTVAVTNVTNNAGLIEIQTAFPTALGNSFPVVISGVTGTVEANGPWLVETIDSTHFTLKNSTFTNAYVSGGTVQYSAMGQVSGLGTQPVSTVTCKVANVASGLGLTTETLYVELLVAYPTGNGLSSTPVRDEQALAQTFMVNNPTLLPNLTPWYFDPAQLTVAHNPAYSFFNATPSLASLDWTHREARMMYTTTALPTINIAADSETAAATTFTLPERAILSGLTITKSPAFGVGVGFSLDPSGRIVTISGGSTAPGDVLHVSYKALRPWPQNGVQVTIFFDIRAPQTARNQVIGTSLAVIPKYIPKTLYSLTSGVASPDQGYPFPYAYVQTGGVYAGSAPSPTFTEYELSGEALISISDFNASTGLLALPVYVPYTPDPDQVTFLRSGGDIDSEGRSFFKQTTGGQYIPNAYAQDLSDPQRHKVFLPFIAELAVDSPLGFAGELVMVLLTRWAASDAINGVFFDTNLVVSTTAASVFRLRNNMLNKRA